MKFSILIGVLQHFDAEIGSHLQDEHIDMSANLEDKSFLKVKASVNIRLM